MPSLLDSAVSLAIVWMNAPISDVQDLPDPDLEAKYEYEADGLSNGRGGDELQLDAEDAGESRGELQSPEQAAVNGRRSRSSSASSTASTSPFFRDGEDIYPGEKGDFHKRTTIPVLQFLDVAGNDITADTDPSRVVSARPRPGSSLRLEKLLAAGVDVISQVWTATVLPTGYKVIVKLFTDQHAKMQPDVYVPQETYEKSDWSRASLGGNAQYSLCRERDRFKSMVPIQGNYVPYSFGYYAVRPRINCRKAI